MQQTFHGKPFQPIIRQRGNLRLIYMEQSRRGNLRKVTRIDDLIDGNREAHSGLLFAGVGQAKIREDIARALNENFVMLCACHVAPRHSYYPSSRIFGRDAQVLGKAFATGLGQGAPAGWIDPSWGVPGYRRELRCLRMTRAFYCFCN